MKYIIFLLSLLPIQSCISNRNNKGTTSIATDSILKEKKSEINLSKNDSTNSEVFVYSSATLRDFADSISKIDPNIWVNKIIHFPDSIFKNQKDLEIELSNHDFSELKIGCKEGKLKTEFIKKVFPDFRFDSTNYMDEIINGYFPITFYSFDNTKFEFMNYAIVPGYSGLNWDCKVYFFNSNKIIAEHNVFHRYGLILNHFKNSNGNTICYYRQNFQSGSGIWWFNNNFYMFDNNKLMPVLDELQEANLQYPWSIRSFWLSSTIEKTNPLTIKFIYYNEFPDPSNKYPIKIIDDSTIVQYNWDNSNKQFKPDFSKSKLNRFKILTYYLMDNELLFINSQYNLIKQFVNGDDTVKRQMTFCYLNLVKSETIRQKNKASH